MRFRLPVILAVASLLTACGGGGGGGSDPNITTGSPDVVTITASGPTAPVPSVANTDVDFVITNPGTTTASNVALSVTLGAGLVKAGVQCFGSAGAACPTDPNVLQVPMLPPGGSLRFVMSVTPQAGTSGTIASAATVSATNDQVKSNNDA